jgi:hypothetical protein
LALDATVSVTENQGLAISAPPRNSGLALANIKHIENLQKTHLTIIWL